MPDEERSHRSRNDWRALVRERLGALSLNAATQEDVLAELASYLEDCVLTAARGGVSESEALTAALEEVPDWVALNHEISAAKKERNMTPTAKTLWVPGTGALAVSAILLMVMARIVAPAAWDHPRAPEVLGGAWLLFYVGIGALGASWSRRAGGSVAMRFSAGVFPIALHTAIFLCVFFAALLQSHSPTPEWLNPRFLLRVFLTMILLPGMALSVGTLPLLRDRPNQSVPSRA